MKAEELYDIAVARMKAGEPTLINGVLDGQKCVVLDKTGSVRAYLQETDQSAIRYQAQMALANPSIAKEIFYIYCIHAADNGVLLPEMLDKDYLSDEQSAALIILACKIINDRDAMFQVHKMLDSIIHCLLSYKHVQLVKIKMAAIAYMIAKTAPMREVRLHQWVINIEDVNKTSMMRDLWEYARNNLTPEQQNSRYGEHNQTPFMAFLWYCEMLRRPEYARAASVLICDQKLPEWRMV